MATISEDTERGGREPRQGGSRSPWFRRQWVLQLTVALAVSAGLWLTVTPRDEGLRWEQLGLAVAAVTGVMLSSRLPIYAVILSAAATGGAWLLGVTGDPFVLTGIAVFRLAESRGGRRFPWWMCAGALALLVASSVLSSHGIEDRYRGMMLSAIVLSVAWVLGVRTREVRDEAAARSRVEERLRLARDVHDVLSHSLGAIGVQAGVAAHVAALDAVELRSVLRGIEGDARSSLAELKGLLQRERLGPGFSAATSLTAALASLVQTAERAGIAANLEVTGASIDALPVEVRTTVLRVAQEAVTNVLRHSGAASLTVAVRVLSDAATVWVEDDGRNAPAALQPGHGLTGMRERVELLGGAMEVTPSPVGCTVCVTLPLGSPPEAGGNRR